MRLESSGPGINKQAIGAEAPPTSREAMFARVRPLIVTHDNETSDAHALDTMAHEVGHRISGLQVPMSNAFIDQVVSQYMSTIFPWALKYTCGGPDCFDLFSNLERDAEAGRCSVREPWRRVNNEAVLSPGKYVQMHATRLELQLSADWMFVPSARNLCWRYEVLRISFTVVQIRTAKDTDHYQHLVKMLEAMNLIWKSKAMRL